MPGRRRPWARMNRHRDYGWVPGKCPQTPALRPSTDRVIDRIPQKSTFDGSDSEKRTVTVIAREQLSALFLPRLRSLEGVIAEADEKGAGQHQLAYSGALSCGYKSLSSGPPWIDERRPHSPYRRKNPATDADDPVSPRPAHTKEPKEPTK